MVKANLSSGQRKIIAEFLANLALAWLVASIIGPVLDPSINLTNRLPSMTLGSGFAVGAMLASLLIAKGLNHDTV